MPNITKRKTYCKKIRGKKTNKNGGGAAWDGRNTSKKKQMTKIGGGDGGDAEG